MNGTIALLEIEYAERIGIVKIIMAMLVLTSMPFSFYCYQETATNNSTCGDPTHDPPGAYSSSGTFGARNPATQAYDANWGSFASDREDAIPMPSYIYFGYHLPTRPSNESVNLAGTIWRMKFGRTPPFAALEKNNTDIYSECEMEYNNTISLPLRAILYDESAGGLSTSYNKWECIKPGTNATWTTLETTQGGTGSEVATAYEEGIYWEIGDRASINTTCGTGGDKCRIEGSNGYDLPFIPSANLSINATPLADYAFSNWSITNGTCNITNASNANTIVAKTTFGNCAIQANFIQLAVPITNCTTLDTGTYYLNQSISINNSTCLTLSKQNTEIDCRGFSITGNNTINTYGIYTNQMNTTIRNCIINDFYIGLNTGTSSHNSSFINNTINIGYNASGSYGLLSQGNFHQITDNTLNKTIAGYALYANADDTIITGGQYYHSSAYAILAGSSNDRMLMENISYATIAGYLMQTQSKDSIIRNITLTGTGGGILINTNSRITVENCDFRISGIPIYAYAGTLPNIIQNNHLNTSATGYGGIHFYQMHNSTFRNNEAVGTRYSITSHVSAISENNTIYNNTLKGNHASYPSVYIRGTMTANTFYWNNFTGISNAWFSDNSTTKGNFFNTTEGNIYPDVMNGSVNITGSTASAGFPLLYVGDGGEDYPYNSTNGKMIDAVDYAPLTPYFSASETISPGNFLIFIGVGFIFVAMHKKKKRKGDAHDG